MDKSILAIFTDVRGFTNWSNEPEVFSNLKDFIEGLIGILRRHFPEPHFLKPLGDGAMIIRHLKKADSEAEGRVRLLGGVLQTIQAVNMDFDAHCRAFAGRVGHETDLRLGWGVVRGKAVPVGDDFAGHNLNLCARLCGEARPFGVVISKADFPEMPPPEPFEFFPQVRRLTGIGEVAVWVTKEIGTQFLTREQIRQQPEVHVAGHCIDQPRKNQIRILLAKRAATRSLYPGLIEGCGGQLAASETFTEGVARHFRLEMGIEVRVLEDVHCFYVIEKPNTPVIPGIRFLCQRVGDAEPRPGNHEWVKWVSEREFRNMDATLFIPELRDQVVRLLEQYKSLGY
jgi:class 3 adenylate cyclase/ADP-ribose pyrophosphatase YjhB (NUDIX family)